MLGNWGDRLCPDCKLEENRKTKRKAQNRAYYLAHRAPKPLVSPCVDCGTDVHQNGGPGVFKRCGLCRVKASAAATCRYRAKSRKPSRVSRCIDCGVSIRNTGPGPMAQRCVPHKKLAQRAASERYERRTLAVLAAGAAHTGCPTPTTSQTPGAMACELPTHSTPPRRRPDEPAALHRPLHRHLLSRPGARLRDRADSGAAVRADTGEPIGVCAALERVIAVPPWPSDEQADDDEGLLP